MFMRDLGSIQNNQFDTILALSVILLDAENVS